MKKHTHCSCDADQSDWRRGRYEPAEPPESEQRIYDREERRAAPKTNEPRTRTRRQS